MASDERVAALAAASFWVPSQLITPAPAIGGDRARADSHVHHGGLFSFCDLALCAQAVTTAPSAEGTAATVQLADAMRLQSCVNLVRGILAPPVGKSARSLRNLAADVRRTWSSARPRVVESLQVPPATDPLTNAEMDLRLHAVVDDPSLTVADRALIIVAVTWLYHQTRQRFGTGFWDFYSRYRRLTFERLPYERVLDQQARRAGVTALEVRRNVPGRFAAEAFTWMVGELLDALPTSLEIACPLAISRRVPDRSAGAGVALLDGGWLGGVGGEVRRHLKGIDVNGPETESLSGWFIALQVDRLAAQMSAVDLDPHVTMHGGESWEVPVSGLRRIAETQMAARHRARRIGHALALSKRWGMWSASRWAAAVRSSRLVDIRFDVLWVASLGLPGWEDGLAAAGLSADDVGRYRELFAHTTWDQHGWTDPLRLEISAREMAGLGLDPWWFGFGADRGSDLPLAHQRTIARHLRQCFPDLRADVVATLRADRVVVEACPTSNVWIMGDFWYDEHPLWELVDQDELLVALSTDNPGHFGTDAAEEERRLLAHIPEGMTRARGEEIVETCRLLGLSSCLAGAS